MLTLWNQFDDLFGNDDLWRWPVRTAERRFLPSVDIRETENAYVLAADVPGVPTENIDVSVKDGVLTLTIPVAEEARPRRIEIQHATSATAIGAGEPQPQPATS